jgi:hypothetical protein
MFVRSHRDLHVLKRSVEQVNKLSDRLIGIGPFGIGLDGITAWIPGVGALYSAAAGGFLMVQAVRARAAPMTLAHMAAILLADTFTDLIPIPVAPAVTDMLFTGQKWAANALLKHMDRTLYYEGTRAEADADAEFQRHLAEGGARGRRIVYLG